MNVPPFLQHLVDDAAVFPPASTPLPDALLAHREHLEADHAELVGPFVIDDRRLPQLADLIGGEQLAVTVVVTGGAGAVAPAVAWAARAEGLDLRAVEIALRDPDDLANNARRVVAAVDRLVAAGELADEVPVYVEPPRPVGGEPSHGWLSALDEVAAMDHRLKFRTGGDAGVPGVAELGACIGAALDRELRFKCTAGLHHAVRNEDGHGFLNVLLATRASLDGLDPRVALELTDPSDVRRAVADAGDLTSARRWFTSFGSCSINEPLDDLEALGLL